MPPNVIPATCLESWIHFSTFGSSFTFVTLKDKLVFCLGYQVHVLDRSGLGFKIGLKRLVSLRRLGVHTQMAPHLMWFVAYFGAHVAFVVRFVTLFDQQVVDSFEFRGLFVNGPFHFGWLFFDLFFVAIFREVAKNVDVHFALVVFEAVQVPECPATDVALEGQFGRVSAHVTY